MKGEALVASCIGSADPPPMIQWFKGDQLLNQSPERVSVTQSNEGITTMSRLTVTGFTSEDAGEYSCRVANDLGNVSSYFHVNAVGESAVLQFFHFLT